MQDDGVAFFAVFDSIGEQVLDDGVELACIDPYLERLVGVFKYNGLVLRLGQLGDLVDLALEVGYGLVAFDACDAFFYACQLITHYTVCHV